LAAPACSDSSGGKWGGKGLAFSPDPCNIQYQGAFAAHGAKRVNRGGSWVNDADLCRVANRNNNHPANRNNNLGFRLARSL